MSQLQDKYAAGKLSKEDVSIDFCKEGVSIAQKTCNKKVAIPSLWRDYSKSSYSGFENN